MTKSGDNFYYRRWFNTCEKVFCVYKDLIISTIVDVFPTSIDRKVYKDLIISTIVDSQYSLLRSIGLRPNPR